MWSIEDEPASNIGPLTRIRAVKLKNVGRGPAFGISCTCVDAWEPKQELYGAVMISPCAAVDSEESVEIAFVIPWDELPKEAVATTIVHLLYAALGERRHPVRMHLAVPKSANHSFGGAKKLAPRLFMTRRETTVIKQPWTIGRRRWDQVRAWWRNLRSQNPRPVGKPPKLAEK